MMLLLIFLDAEDNGRWSWLKSKKKSSQSARGGGDFFFRVATKIKRNWIGRGFGIDCSSDVRKQLFFFWRPTYYRYPPQADHDLIL